VKQRGTMNGSSLENQQNQALSYMHVQKTIKTMSSLQFELFMQ